MIVSQGRYRDIEGDKHMDIVLRLFLLMLAVMMVVFGATEIILNA